MTADRPATEFWQRAEQERRERLAAYAAKTQQRMLTAAGVEVEELSARTRRTLAWLAENDTDTIDSLVELLQAAHRAGHHARPDTPDLSTGQSRDADAVTARLDAISRRSDNPAVEL